jgi:23S rRNA maturation-related 3'-5' exoribonuclease YhaM
MDMLTLWNAKQAGHALHGLVHVARLVPSKRLELRAIGEEYSHADRGVVRKAAKELLKVIDSP